MDVLCRPAAADCSFKILLDHESVMPPFYFFFAEGFPNIGDDSKDYEDYEGANAVENDADKETRRVPTPKFISESSHILVNEGDTVKNEKKENTNN